MSDAWLALDNGMVYHGRVVGVPGETMGEVVFNTSMTGYQEILTDPSYAGQIVLMTYPHIGNYGVNADDAESRNVWAQGFIVRELVQTTSNFRAEQSLSEYLTQHKMTGIQGIDTRAITVALRTTGAMRGIISTTEHDPETLLARVRASTIMSGQDLASQVTCATAYDWDEPTRRMDVLPTRGALRPAHRITVMDFGVKHNILRELVDRGCTVRVVPAQTTAEDILQDHPDGVLLSNGPGDPAAVHYAVKTITHLVDHVPLFGICLGHQLLGLALGGTTYKLKFGHHGANHPVKDLRTGRVAITSQNHGFAVDLDSIPNTDMQLTHVNLNDNTAEGMVHPGRKLMSVQYHPEAAPGPHDANDLFDLFLHMIDR
jgi:carbamoyl-phosphate synthase small subunit